jgi:membrane-bound lytic murein transglycosylase A
VDKPLLRSRLAWWLLAANLVAVAAVIWISGFGNPFFGGPFALRTVAFSELPGWAANDPRAALASFRRSCTALLRLPAQQPMGWRGYAGTPAAWRPACAAAPSGGATPAQLRGYFETWFAPVRVEGEKPPQFTGYYEPLLAVSRTRTARFHVPIYGRPADLIVADLGKFRANLTGRRLIGRVAGTQFVPFQTRAEIDARGLASAPVLLYADDPVSVFFLHIQGSGRVRFADGETLRLVFVATNGRPYTPIGRVLIEKGALERSGLSMQRIRNWLETHPSDENAIMEYDQSFVFFSLAPLGDPALGSGGTEGVPLTPGASLAIDGRIHPMGAPVYIATTTPGPRSGEQPFERLLVTQDTGGAITGPGRGDIFFGFGANAESTAGRMNAQGRFYVLLPKPVAAALSPYRAFADSPS